MTREGGILKDPEPRDFFKSGFYEDYYGWRLTERESKKDAKRVLKLLDAKHGHILDWCAGWGRHAIYFAQKGFQVTILDFVGRYLRIAKKRFQERGLPVSTIEVDCRDTPSEIQADFATCLFGSIGFLETPEQLDAFKSLYGAMKPGGKIIIDCMNLFAIPRFVKTTERKRKDGCIFRSHKRFDFQENRKHMTFEIISPTGETRRKRVSQVHYSPHDLTVLVSTAGFEVDNLYGSLDGDPISFESDNIVLVAHKYSTE